MAPPFLARRDIREVDLDRRPLGDFERILIA